MEYPHHFDQFGAAVLDAPEDALRKALLIVDDATWAVATRSSPPEVKERLSDLGVLQKIEAAQALRVGRRTMSSEVAAAEAAILDVLLGG